MGKWTDKSYITHSEWSTLFGGAKASSKIKDQITRHGLRRLPFGFCCLTLNPCTDPVCTLEGHLFERSAIEAYMAYTQPIPLNPVTGNPLSLPLVSLSFYRNEKGEFACPISKKPFHDHLKVVTVRNTGNVYDWETVKELNIDRKYFIDLVDEKTPFTKKDIIVLNDPSFPELRNLNTFKHLECELEQPFSSKTDSHHRPLSSSVTKESTQVPSWARVKKSIERKQQKTAGALTLSSTSAKGSVARILKQLKEKESEMETTTKKIGVLTSRPAYIYKSEPVIEDKSAKDK